MFVIFGWGHHKSENLGPVLPKKCANCKNEEYWQLYKISKWFTLFFLPVFPYDSNKLIVCPVCNHGTAVDATTYEQYKAIAEINKAFSENTITQDERDQRLTEIFTELERTEKAEQAKHSEESKGFAQQVSEKTDEELKVLLGKNREEYNPAFMLAVEEEAKKRGLSAQAE